LTMSARDIELLRRPLPEFRQRHPSYNRRVFAWLKDGIDSGPSDPWWLGRDRFQKRYQIKISDYHYHGGGGIISQIFLRHLSPVDIDTVDTRDRLFAYLKTPPPTMPDNCRFLKLDPRD
jgi:hypothetical protein